MPPVLSTRGLAKTYRTAFSRLSIRALEPIDLDVASGEVFGLLGPNGAGKTTLVKLLLGIAHPSRGSARLFGLPAGTPEARNRIGFLPENHRFPDYLTADQALDLYGRLAKLPAGVRTRRIPELLARTGLTTWRHTRIRAFSKGMMQRLGLAQALLNDPDLLFLDEPTDGVDPIGRREIRDLLLGLRAEGKTIFLNSHLLSEVEQLCTRVAILARGRLVREGTLADLTAPEKGYEVQATPIPEALLRELSPALTPAPDGPAPLPPPLRRYRVAAGDRDHLNQLLDRLRAHGVLLEAVLPVRQTLEDYFIDVVEKAGEKL